MGFQRSSGGPRRETPSPPRSPPEAAREAVKANCPLGVDAEVFEYLADSAASIFEDGACEADQILQELEAAAGPFLEDAGLSAEDVVVFCQRVCKGVLMSSMCSRPVAAKTMSIAELAGKDCLCYVPNLLLMYGGSPQPLLKNTTLELVKGHRYGIVGANGTGKTTLMARIANGDIVGFPQDLLVVHLRHDSILRGVENSTTVREYAHLRSNSATSEEDLAQALVDVGFHASVLDRAVLALSGGWQMRLALACAVVQKANLLLLDEPTNHLDAEAVAWLVGFIKQARSTAIIVSHDAGFLNKVCTQVIHFTPDAKLDYYPGNFEEFRTKVLQGDSVQAERLLGGRQESACKHVATALVPADRLVFPNPEKLDVMKAASASKLRPVALKLTEASFQYACGGTPVLDGINTELLPSSRIGIVGRNGSGKSTLLSLIAARLRPCLGDVWFHPSLRLVYIAQHSDSQLSQYMQCTPTEYMQLRFRRGYDAEALPRQELTKPTEHQAKRIGELAKRHGHQGAQVDAILGRLPAEKDGKEVIYEVSWKGLSIAHNTFEKRGKLKALGVEYLAEEYDMWMSQVWGTSSERRLTSGELVKHFEDFGLPEDISSKRQISMLSSGQRSKVLLAASLWTRPHIVCLDEPTNYMDAETVSALTRALQKFRGGFVIASHSEAFIADTCEEVWTVADGRITTHGQYQQAKKRPGKRP